MKAKINRLARGTFEKENTELILSKNRIEDCVVSDGNKQGCITITGAYDKNIKGIVYSDNYRVVVENPGFTGTSAAVIEYTVNAKGLASEEKISGNLSVVSDGSEFKIPFEFEVIDAYAETSLGNVSNLFHFANLVQHSYEEALALFCSEEFKDIFLKNDSVLQAVYEGLIKSKDIKIALEEFLIYANKKKRLTYSIDTDKKEYADFTESYADRIMLQKSGWGYGRLAISVSEDFVVISKDNITTEDFAGNVYEIGYLIDYDKLHAGNNYCRITITAGAKELTCDIIVHKAKEAVVSDVDEEEVETDRIKRSIFELSKLYFEFRMRRISTDNWARASLQLLEYMRSLDDTQELYKLFQAQVLIAQKKPEEAVSLINGVGARILAGKKKQEFLYCYYLYVRTLYSKNEAVTKDALHDIREIYQKNYDYRIMWILLHLDEEYAINKSLRLARIKEQYVKGARTPFLYFEACAVLNEQPALLRVLNPFEIQAVWWGCRNDMLGEKVAEQFAQLLIAEKKFNPVVYRIMAYFCRKYKNSNILLEVLNSYILKTAKPDKKYFGWYEAGVKAELKVSNLYETYTGMLDSYDEPVPHIVALYFAYNNMLDDEKKAFLYVNILKHEAEHSNITRNYIPQIKNFAKEQLEAGKITDDLAYIYRKEIEKNDINKKNAGIYAELQLTKKLECKQGTLAYSMPKIVVKHKELTDEKIYPLVNGEAYFTAYTQDVIILFEDEEGNRYFLRNEYKCKELLNQSSMIKFCASLSNESIGLQLHMCENEGTYKNTLAAASDLYEKLETTGVVKKEYINHIYRRMIDYYADNAKGDILEHYLKKADVNMLPPNERTGVIELLLIRGLYEEAYELMKVHGYDNISTNRLMRFCTMKLRLAEIREEDKFLTEVCAYVFHSSKYGEEILLYLLRYYNSNTKDLYKLWKASVDFGVDPYELEERLLGQKLFSEVHISGDVDVFDSYYARGRRGIVTKAYINSQAYAYFIQDMVLPERIFKYLEKEVFIDTEPSNIAKMALLRYYSDAEELTDKQLATAKTLVDELYKAGYVFAFYSNFADEFELPFELRDKIIIEYKTSKDRYIELKYLLDSDEAEDDNYRMEIMEESYEGIYVRPFVIFYGEKLEYYIEERSEETETLTESATKEMLAVKLEGEIGKYEMLNDICTARALGDEHTLNEAVREYEKRVKLSEELFLPIVED